MDFVSALIYGVVQGLTEFLPVSSSGHLAILPLVLKIKDPGVLFDLSMHLGTALSITVYFKAQLQSLWRAGRDIIFQLVTQKGSCRSIFLNDRPENALMFNLALATLSTFILALLLEGPAIAYGRAPFWIACNLFSFGIFMWLADVIARPDGQMPMQKLSAKLAIFVGAAQALAIFPGVSRSGCTLTAARLLGASRTQATQFSFLLSLPIIVAGLIFKLPEFFKATFQFDLGLCLLGVITSFAVGLFAIHFFFHSIKKWGFAPFTIYRIFLAAGVYYFSTK